MGILFLLASYPVVWAAPSQNALRQTVPTFTPTSVAPTATPHPSATPTATLPPGYTRLILQQGSDGYAGAVDTYLSFAQPSGNFSTQQRLLVRGNGERVALLHFDLPDIPQGVTIVEAVLQLYAAERSTTQSMQASAYRVLREWDAQEATWEKATAGEQWNLPGCNGLGTDRSIVADGTATVDSTGYVFTFDVTDMVRDWVADPSQNYGLVVQGVEGGSVEYRFASAEHDVAAQRPALVITYIGGTTPTPTLAGPTFTPSPTPTPLSMTFQYGVAPYPGYEGVADTYINAWDSDQNYAAEGRVAIRAGDVKAGLIRFDLSSIPSDSLVTSAELEVYVTYRSNTAHLTTSVYRVLRPWVMDEVTWERASAGALWGEAGCNRTNEPNPDRSEEAENVQVLGSKGISDPRYQFDVTEMTQYWVTSPDENYGLVLKGGTGSSVEYRLGASRNFVPPSQRPKLIVHFIPGGLAVTPTPTTEPTSTPTPMLGGIVGTVWHDKDGDKTIGEGEHPLVGVQVILRNDWREPLDWCVTDSEGRYAFEQLPPDQWYRVSEVNPPGYISTTSDEVRVLVRAGVTLPVDFGDRPGLFMPLILK